MQNYLTESEPAIPDHGVLEVSHEITAQGGEKCSIALYVVDAFIETLYGP